MVGISNGTLKVRILCHTVDENTVLIAAGRKCASVNGGYSAAGDTICSDTGTPGSGRTKPAEPQHHCFALYRSYCQCSIHVSHTTTLFLCDFTAAVKSVGGKNFYRSQRTGDALVRIIVLLHRCRSQRLSGLRKRSVSPHTRSLSVSTQIGCFIHTCRESIICGPGKFGSLTELFPTVQSCIQHLPAIVWFAGTVSRYFSRTSDDAHLKAFSAWESGRVPKILVKERHRIVGEVYFTRFHISVLDCRTMVFQLVAGGALKNPQKS